MNSVLMIAAVLLGADDGTSSSSVELQQPAIAQHAEPVAIVFGHVPPSHASSSVEKGLIRPVGYEPQQTSPSPAVRVVKAHRVGGFSMLQDASPSDSILRQQRRDDSPPPVPTLPESVLQEEAAPRVLPEAYVAEADYGCDSTCQAWSDGCSMCTTHMGCGCHGHHCGFWCHHGLPSTWHAPGNMLPHIPYTAYPKTYYYFRPYNMLHIPQQQERALAWVENPALPYSNKVFDRVYAELEPVLNAPREEVAPGQPLP